jgi:hypothetical protein
MSRTVYPDLIYAQMAEESRNFEWPALEKKLGEKLIDDNKFVSFGHDDNYLTFKTLA